MLFRFKMGENYNNLKELRDKVGFQELYTSRGACGATKWLSERR
jgi:hypothetical protein